jgi:hypothetical protein
MMHPDGVSDEKALKILAPLRGATPFRFVPVVFASLQPPATIYQPSGLTPPTDSIIKPLLSLVLYR